MIKTIILVRPGREAENLVKKGFNFYAIILFELIT